MAELIVLVGAADIEKATQDAGVDVVVPFPLNVVMPHKCKPT